MIEFHKLKVFGSDLMIECATGQGGRHIEPYFQNERMMSVDGKIQEIVRRQGIVPKDVYLVLTVDVPHYSAKYRVLLYLGSVYHEAFAMRSNDELNRNLYYMLEGVRMWHEHERIKDGDTSFVRSKYIETELYRGYHKYSGLNVRWKDLMPKHVCMNKVKACDYLGITRPTLDKYIRLGDIPYKKRGMRYVLHVDDLDEFKLRKGLGAFNHKD